MGGIVQSLVNAVKAGLQQVVELLPPSPFRFPAQGEFSVVMGYVNYFIPIGEMVTIMQYWLLAIAVWYAAMVFLRWLKAIQ